MNKSKKIHPQTGEAQQCFPVEENGKTYMICNFTVAKNGGIIQSSKGFVKFPVKKPLKS